MVELKDFKIFSDLSPKELSELESKIRKIKYGRGEVIFQEGAPAFGFYLVFEGHVKLVKRTLGGKKQILKLVGPGEIIGETTLFDKGVHIAYARTLTKTVVGFVERGEFFDFLIRHPPGGLPAL
jgi:CRP-like cAMP-binding protein